MNFGQESPSGFKGTLKMDRLDAEQGQGSVLHKQPESNGAPRFRDVNFQQAAQIALFGLLQFVRLHKFQVQYMFRNATQQVSEPACHA